MDARSLLRAKKADVRINHPYATYTASGQLRCSICAVPGPPVFPPTPLVSAFTPLTILAGISEAMGCAYPYEATSDVCRAGKGGSSESCSETTRGGESRGGTEAVTCGCGRWGERWEGWEWVTGRILLFG